MKKRVVLMLFCMCIGAFSVGCSSDAFDQVTEKVTGLIDGSDSDNEEMEIEEVEEEEKETDSTSDDDSKEETSKLKKDAVETTTDGIYSGYLQSSAKDQAGVPDETGAQRSIIYATELTGDSFCIAGSCGYRQSEAQDILSVTESNVFSFNINGDSKFFYSGGVDGPEEMDKNKFKKELSELADSELALQIYVENGVATEIYICS